MQKETEMNQQRPGFQCCLPIRDVSCENELEELMHQIDIMVNSKKVEWEQQVIVLEQRIQAQDKELSEARNALDEKTCEIKMLCKKLEQADHAEREKVQKYEKQLQALKYQLCKLKKSYEKLNFCNSKNPRDKNAEPCPGAKASQTEIQWLMQKLEEFKVRSKEWENQRVLYQNHLKSLSEQRKTLTEKCELYQKQSQSYQEQLSSRTQLQDEAITNNQAEIRRLRCQLDVSQETIRSDRVIIENLKSTVKEITLGRNSLKDENQKLFQELKHCQKRCQSVEIELSEVKIELQARDDLLRAVELDQKQMLKAIPDAKLYTNPQGKELSTQEQSEPRMYQTQNEELAWKMFNLSTSKQDQIENDLQKEEAKNNDLERLRTDITDLTAKLNQKDITMATRSENRSRLEQDLDLKEHNKVNEQALKAVKELQDGAEPHIGNLQPKRERTRDYHIKLHVKREVMEQLPVKMKVTPKLIIKAETQINGDQGRSFMEKNNYKAPNQTTGYSNNNQPSQSEWDIDLCDSDWESTSGSFMINLDTLQANGNLQNGGHPEDLDYPDFCRLFVYGQQRDLTMCSSTGTSFISAAEKFLNEENRRAEDFEKVLNSHIEEMQRYSENTLAKYTILHQNRHI
ncbi:deuterosome assembly 1 isoform X1 [Pelobates cultripes]|nr:deuterosome assembly 1 isoform X1 [Pelobates cultripes]